MARIKDNYKYLEPLYRVATINYKVSGVKSSGIKKKSSGTVSCKWLNDNPEKAV